MPLCIALLIPHELHRTCSFQCSRCDPLQNFDLQGTKQVTRAAVEFYGPDRAKFLGE